jgi:hypothetical protein
MRQRIPTEITRLSLLDPLSIIQHPQKPLPSRAACSERVWRNGVWLASGIAFHSSSRGLINHSLPFSADQSVASLAIPRAAVREF